MLSRLPAPSTISSTQLLLNGLDLTLSLIVNPGVNSFLLPVYFCIKNTLCYMTGDASVVDPRWDGETEDLVQV